MSMYRPSGFDRIPPVVKNLLIINAIMLLATYVLQQSAHIDLNDTLGLHYWKSSKFKPWQLITHLFMHGNFWHLLSNMFALWMFGSVLENRWGPQRFLMFYFVCGLGAALCHLVVLHFQISPVLQEYYSLKSQLITAPDNIKEYYLAPYQRALDQPTVGASGAVFGLLFAFGYLFPELEVYVYFAIPLKAKWFVAIYAALELYAGIQNSAGDNVAHFAHLGGMIFAFILLRIWRQPYGGGQRYRY